MCPAVGAGKFGEARLHFQRLPAACATHLNDPRRRRHGRWKRRLGFGWVFSLFPPPSAFALALLNLAYGYGDQS